jgi:hypothetical protein
MFRGGGGAVYANSTKQNTNTRSSCETELQGNTIEGARAVGAGNFLKEQGYDTFPMRIFNDNQSAIRMSEFGRPMSSSTRHMELKHFFMKDYIERKLIELAYLPTEEMVADILTKPLQGKLFRYLRTKLMNHEWEEDIPDEVKAFISIFSKGCA